MIPGNKSLVLCACRILTSSHPHIFTVAESPAESCRVLSSRVNPSSSHEMPSSVVLVRPYADQWPPTHHGKQFPRPLSFATGTRSSMRRNNVWMRDAPAPLYYNIILTKCLALSHLTYAVGPNSHCPKYMIVLSYLEPSPSVPSPSQNPNERRLSNQFRVRFIHSIRSGMLWNQPDPLCRLTLGRFACCPSSRSPLHTRLFREP